MRSVVLAALATAIAAAGCTTHHRVTAGPSYAMARPDQPVPRPGDPPASEPTKLGGELTGELSAGGDDGRFLLAGSVRAGSGITGAGVRAGVVFGNQPRSTGIHGSFSLGPAFVPEGTTLDLRLALGVDLGFRTDPAADSEDNLKRTTVGVELFLSAIGTGDDQHVMLGLGLSVGAYHRERFRLDD